MKRLTLILLVALAALAVAGALVALYAPEVGLLTPRESQTLWVEALPEPVSQTPLHLDPDDVEAEAPALYGLLETAYAEGEASSKRASAIRESFDYLESQGWNGSSDVEYRGAWFSVSVSLGG